MSEAFGIGNKPSETNVASPSLRILVVDDDSLSQSMMEILLSQQGHIAEFASSGAEALEAIQSRRFDLVFMDTLLPDMNGPDVCRQVRAQEDGKGRVPIAALTAFDLPGQPLELLRAGMDDYIFKPYDSRQLARMIYLYAGDPGKGTIIPGSSEEQNGLADSQAPVLDTQRALLAFSPNVSDYRTLLASFVAALPKRLKRMHEAAKAGALRELAREAHNLKSVAASLGATQLSRLATRLEQTSDDREVAASEQLLQQIGEGVQAVQSEAQAFLGT